MRQVVRVETWRKYARVTVDLWPLPPASDMDEQQREAVAKLIHNYIISHWDHPRVRKQYYSVGCDYASFICLKEDAPRLKAELEKIIFRRA
jgi:hypothetical protein